MRISDWSSDVCSSDLERFELVPIPKNDVERFRIMLKNEKEVALYTKMVELAGRDPEYDKRFQQYIREGSTLELRELARPFGQYRSEEHTSELQSLMRISYAVFCFKKTKNNKTMKTIR